MSVRRLFVTLICGLGLPLVTHAADAESQETDWPCVQILVPEVPAAVVWAGPPITELGENWWEIDDVNKLVQRLTAPNYDQDRADSEIAEFAAKQKPAQKDPMLTLLFAGVLESLNNDRKKMLDGIKRYARGQAERATRLGDDLDEIIRLESDTSAAAKSRLEMMQKEMEIKQRMFDERETFIQHLCTRPAVIEQKLGSLARTIAYYLD